MITEEQVMEALKSVYDPEIPINIVDLGFIYNVDIELPKIKVLMTLTVPGCPMHQVLTGMVKDKLLEMDEVEEVEVELTFEPRWTTENISIAGKEKLRALGYKV